MPKKSQTNEYSDITNVVVDNPTAQQASGSMSELYFHKRGHVFNHSMAVNLHTFETRCVGSRAPWRPTPESFPRRHHSLQRV